MREEGIPRKIDINLFPLLPFPFSLNHKVKSPPKAEEINKKPPYGGSILFKLYIVCQFALGGVVACKNLYT
jgi:hypothetical protein